MKKFNFAYFSDIILLSAIIFGVLLILLTPLNQPFLIKIFLSAFLTALIILLVVFVKNKNSIRKKSKSTAKKELKYLGEILEIMPDNRLIALLIEFLKTYNPNVKKVKNHIENENTLFFFNFDTETDRQTLAAYLRASDDKKVVLFCNQLSGDCLTLAKNHSDKLFIVDLESFRILLKEKNILDKFLQGYEITAPQMGRLEKCISVIKKVFTKKRAKNFTIIGAILLLFSYIVFFPIFYRVSALICFVTALLCLIFGKNQIISSPEFSTFIETEKANP